MPCAFSYLLEREGGLDKRIILKSIFKKWDWSMGCIDLLMIGIYGGLL